MTRLEEPLLVVLVQMPIVAFVNFLLKGLLLVLEQVHIMLLVAPAEIGLFRLRVPKLILREPVLVPAVRLRGPASAQAGHMVGLRYLGCGKLVLR